MNVLTVLFHEWGGDMGYNLTKMFSAKRLCTTQHAVPFTPMISLRNKVVIELEEYSDKICIKETNVIFCRYLMYSSIHESKVSSLESLSSSYCITIQKIYPSKLFLWRDQYFHYNQEISWDLKITYWRILKFNKTTILNNCKNKTKIAQPFSKAKGTRIEHQWNVTSGRI